jgi:hypothetical protein
MLRPYSAWEWIIRGTENDAQESIHARPREDINVMGVWRNARRKRSLRL